ncbi:SMI1/KNR4 family protein [Roseateles amylovorans]|uniref:SMI1/KNR4 family protein n=1 Tax=Roseateles amylovorans TaxID=2978473 RepID=A0ABY6AV51_9BURK|nr:SMI1/KNR4 family protein [Roseateles amylovorans]UXH76183.1 SMI1/KNR4 family protein [Roseateles amylovorans]
MKITQLARVGQLNRGADSNELIALEQQLGYTIPSEHKVLLQMANGFTLENGVFIYSSSELFERNSTFEVDRYSPGYIAIGDDSGGRSILIAREKAGVFLVDQGSMDPDEFELISQTLSIWLSDSCSLRAR